MLEAVTALALIVALMAIAVAVWALRRTPSADQPRSDGGDLAVLDDPPPADRPVLVARPGAVEGELELWADGVSQPVARVRSLATTISSRPTVATPLVTSALSTLVRAARPMKADISGRYLVSLSPGALVGADPATLGGDRLMELGRLGTALTPSPLTVLTAGAAALSLVQQQHLARSISQIDRKISAVVTRLQHDDHGALAAANELLELVMHSASQGAIPDQLRLELAQTRVQVNALHHARARPVSEFLDRVTTTDGEMAAGSVVAEAIDDPDEFQREMLLYLDSVLVRGRLATITALVVAADGHGADAQRLLEEAASSTRGDFYRLQQPLATLAGRHRDAGRLRALATSHRRIAGVIADLEAATSEVEGLLPPAAGTEVELIAEIRDGAVTAVELPAGPDTTTPTEPTERADPPKPPAPAA
ncbi:MAG: hypothetical protein OEW42_16140 [Acidimicrobiia bacterium]|nr:hypothetical protein [Acidimicrobiia bacterium]